MKTFNTEREFVENFATDVKGGETEFTVNGKSFTCVSMEKNASKQAVYTVKLDGQTEFKKLTMPGLKKVLGVEYTAPRNFAGGEKSGKRAGQKLVSPADYAGKTDDDLRASAAKAAEKAAALVSDLQEIARAYGVPVASFFDATFCGRPVADLLLSVLRRRRDNARQKTAKTDRLVQLTADMQKALAAGDFARVAVISATIAEITR